ncbi:MAG: hypothetical protein WCK51_12395 [Armatimonadota bacterium]
MKQSVWHWFAVTGLFIGSVMLALSVVLDPNRLLGAFQDSLLMACVINLGFGAFGGYLGGLIKFLDSRDSVELAALFGVKIGLFVFAVLMIVSLVLKWCDQPPTAAPGTLILAPFAEPGLLCICCDPTWLMALNGVGSAGSSKADRKKLEKEIELQRRQDAEDRKRKSG